MTAPGLRRASARDLLLSKKGLVFLSSSGTNVDDTCVRAVELELADLGYVLSSRLRARLSTCSLDELSAWRAWAWAVLAAQRGADQVHEPLFRSFPEGIPRDTLELWFKKVLIHFVEAEGRPCLFCRRVGTTHVLDPCRHVVCDRCFDGSSYSACPACERRVDRSSPFFWASPHDGSTSPAEKVTFTLLDLGEDLDTEARALFTALCGRKQALSKDDRTALALLCEDYRARALPWLPERIPVRENTAIVFGTLFRLCAAEDVLPAARRHITTATDVLRFLAVFSGADASLQAQTVFKPIALHEHRARLHHSHWLELADRQDARYPAHAGKRQAITLPVETCRFKMSALSRALRRTLLALMEGLRPDLLTEDMLRHRSLWVWAGQFLHPTEYAERYPNVAAAFAIVRRKAADGARAPRFQGYRGRVETAVARKDVTALTALLVERPGELARRLDHALRLAGAGTGAEEQVLQAFAEKVPACATPLLVTLHTLLPTREKKAPLRLFWPKGEVAKGVSTEDDRPALSRRAIETCVSAIESELLRRFGAKPGFQAALVDDALEAIMVPFNERTASPSAVNLPRGSRIPVPEGKVLRFFLHWCEPEEGGRDTDIDLSVGFYSDTWAPAGVCSYYQLEALGPNGARIAASAGDLRNAPFPGGATELVDLHREQALAAGIRFAVMVVNNYSGLPFSRLERGFAGLMLRDDAGGAHFDPRTVELKFALTGDNGVYMPLMVDLREGTLHWLDAYSKGRSAFNNVATSSVAITRVCSRMSRYFQTGARPSMRALALLHAAARAQHVFIRGRETRLFVRGPAEDPVSFHRRLLHGRADEPRARPPRADGPPILAALYHGDVDLPPGSAAYALFRERVTPSLAASDLLS